MASALYTASRRLDVITPYVRERGLTSSIKVVEPYARSLEIVGSYSKALHVMAAA